MGNCLKTQLKESVNNPNLDKINQIRCMIPAKSANAESAVYALNRSNSMLIEILSGNASIKISDVNVGTSGTLPTDEGRFYIVHADNNPVVFHISDFANIQYTNNLFTDYDKLCMYHNCININVTDDYLDSTGLIKLTDLSKLNDQTDALKIGKTANGCLKKGSMSDIARITSLTLIQIENTDVITGQLSELAPCLALENLNLIGQRIEGTVESLAAAMAPNRNSGVLMMRLSGNNVTLNGEPVPYTVTLRFGTDMVNPTEQETAQGYQIA